MTVIESQNDGKKQQSEQMNKTIILFSYFHSEINQEDGI